MQADSHYQAAFDHAKQARLRCQEALDRLVDGSERIMAGVALKYSHRSREYKLVRGARRPGRHDNGSNGTSKPPPQ